MRILVVSQMWPSARDPDLGAFVAQVCRELERQGHALECAVIDRRDLGRTKYLRLARDAVAAAHRFRPDVVYAHFLVPAGAIGALAARVAGAPLVVTAHGTDVSNVGRVPGIRALTRLVVRSAARVIVVSDHLRRRLAE